MQKQSYLVRSAARLIDSARKHGISDEDILYVISHAIEVILLEDEPEKLLYIGFDRSLRALEVIHAMKATQKIIDVLREAHHDI